MTPETNWSTIVIDHVEPISSFDVSNDEEIKETFNWKNTQPFLKQIDPRKGTKFNFLDYRRKLIKAYQFLRLRGEEV